jgi:hypothetical protein
MKKIKFKKEENYMKKILIFTILLLLVFSLAVGLVRGTETIVNPDKPSKGQWDLNPKKIWQVDRAGDDVFSRVEIAAAEDETLYIHDWRNQCIYMIDNNGTFKRAFGTRGEGPGEIRTHLKTFTVKDKLIAADTDRLHYFTQQGKFIKSVPNMFFQREPHIFLNEHEFIAAPTFVVPDDGKGKIAYINLKTGTKRIIGEFSLPRPQSNGPGVSLIGLTPMIITGYDYDNHKLYYGMNDAYEIHVTRLNGKVLNTFSLKRQKKPVSNETLRKQLKLIDASAPVNEIMKQLPKEITCYHRISIHKGHVLVFEDNFGTNWDCQSIDIFSLDGKYLYRTVFNPGPGVKIYFTSIGSILVKGDYLYVVLEDDEGEVVIAKYQIQLPKK